jgi:hypothetical protein
VFIKKTALSKDQMVTEHSFCFSVAVFRPLFIYLVIFHKNHPLLWYGERVQ